MSKEYSTLPTAASGDIRPYTIKISTSKVKDMETLIQVSPIAHPTWENLQVDRKWGLNRDWIINAKKHWVTTFKWEQQEDVLNSLPQFMATVKDDDGTKYEVHFMAMFSMKKDAIPIGFFHGWPVGELLLGVLLFF
jgi:microsomal epoxide hydrolase